MKVLADAEPLGAPPLPASLAIGVFDGVHLGHAAVIRQTLAEARASSGVAVAVTFDRHPDAIVAPDRTPPLLYPLWRRLEALESLGITTALVFPFDAEFRAQPAEAFVQRLTRGFGKIASISVGTQFVFGHGRGGNVELLQRLGRDQGFSVHPIPPCSHGDKPISSTRIRELVAKGAFAEASALLGRPYTLGGAVIEGDRLGRTLGFPTANLAVAGLVLPPLGVYAAVAHVNGQPRAAAVNIGRRPTLASPVAETRVEAHLLDFDGDLYGNRLELQLAQRLRPETRFPSRDALVGQIGRDVQEVRQWAGNMGLL
ncbi:MAG: riboflavin biosynthesis protein RibF [Verrucomicrobiales bacterium]|nr:riboflavin biosynthesis protein RibF [Verrucomicrobiales bacterium]